MLASVTPRGSRLFVAPRALEVNLLKSACLSISSLLIPQFSIETLKGSCSGGRWASMDCSDPRYVSDAGGHTHSAIFLLSRALPLTSMSFCTCFALASSSNYMQSSIYVFADATTIFVSPRFGCVRTGLRAVCIITCIHQDCALHRTGAFQHLGT